MIALPQRFAPQLSLRNGLVASVALACGLLLTRWWAFDLVPSHVQSLWGAYFVAPMGWLALAALASRALSAARCPGGPRNRRPTALGPVRRRTCRRVPRRHPVHDGYGRRLWPFAIRAHPALARHQPPSSRLDPRCHGVLSRWPVARHRPPRPHARTRPHNAGPCCRPVHRRPAHPNRHVSRCRVLGRPLYSGRRHRPARRLLHPLRRHQRRVARLRPTGCLHVLLAGSSERRLAHPGAGRGRRAGDGLVDRRKPVRRG